MQKFQEIIVREALKNDLKDYAREFCKEFQALQH